MGERTANVVPGNIGETLTELAALIAQRRKELPENSYTTKLFTEPVDYVLKKLNEESLELALAIKDDDFEHIRYEAADLVYHLLVALERSEVSLEELAGELNARRH
ncbi:MAG: phosphoribosyl-ATP diphosphatase [Coriobacteriia bacterium]|jgi:phosphoribosyl-ATP pyrophosphohydrolase|nr:phosphoribosyl-ATP diphosphatase [Coriobacteriia bacterium]MDR2714313.1 phosphoribosyl-ATP diphosphatase [Coriobacteriales bacterium]